MDDSIEAYNRLYRELMGFDEAISNPPLGSTPYGPEQYAAQLRSFDAQARSDAIDALLGQSEYPEESV